MNISVNNTPESSERIMSSILAFLSNADTTISTEMAEKMNRSGTTIIAPQNDDEITENVRNRLHQATYDEITRMNLLLVKRFKVRLVTPEEIFALMKIKTELAMHLISIDALLKDIEKIFAEKLTERVRDQVLLTMQPSSSTLH